MHESKHFPQLSKVKSQSSEALSRHVGLYDGYVRACNAIDDRLAALADRPCDPSFAERSELLRRRPFAYDGMILHELFFEALGENTGADQALELRIGHYGGYAKLTADLANVALCGVGWSLLVYDPRADALSVTFVAEHHVGHLLGHDVLLALDSWEHAFAADYGVERARYARAILAETDWGVVSARLRPAPEARAPRINKGKS